MTKSSKMKNIQSLIIIIVFIFSVNDSLSQTEVKIYYNLASQVPFSCSKTAQINYNIFGITSGYNPYLDSLHLKLYFGDQTDTTFSIPIELNNSFSVNFSKIHNYLLKGVYCVKLKVVGNDNNADSIVTKDFIVGDSCDIISGRIFTDLDNNCSYSYIDTPINSNKTINLMFGDKVISSYQTQYSTGSTYEFNAPEGFNYQVFMQNNYNLSFCPASYSTSAPASQKNFGLPCVSGKVDIQGYICSNGNYNPGATVNVKCYAFNTGCEQADGQIKLIYDPNHLSFVSASDNYNLSGDTVIWNFSDLNYSLLDYISSNSAMDFSFMTTAAFSISTNSLSGDTIKYSLLEEPLINDLNPENNNQILYRYVGASYDPNNKTVLPQGEGESGLINNNQNMIYTINFQNTGTAPANNIYIIDTIDINLEMFSLCLLNHSHEPQISFMSDRVIKFNFPDIHLPDSSANYENSMGYFQYAIRQNSNLSEGVQITNKAFIYFDYNEPVQTNTVLNTIYSKSIVNENALINKHFELHPNPSNGIFNIQSGDLSSKVLIEIYNVIGQIVYSDEFVYETNKTIDISTQPKGIYLVKIKSANFSTIEKVVIR